jgi:HK97 family phage major capsid protein
MPVQPTPQQAVIHAAREAAVRRQVAVLDRMNVRDDTYYPYQYDDDERMPVSFFRDLYLSTVKQNQKVHPNVAKRMRQHQERSAKYMRGRYVRDDRMSPLEQRATTAGTYGGLIPPAYLLDLYAKASRNGRVYADGCNQQRLPDTGMSIIVPKITTATAVGMQTEGSTATTQDPAETDLTVNVRTAAGYLTVSRQALERGQYTDQVLFEDLVARYYQQIDSGCISGAGSGVTILGVLNTSNIVTSTTSTATAPGVWTKLIDVIQQINTSMGGIGYVADRIFMHGRRWQWWLAQLDSQGRPVVASTSDPGYNCMGYKDQNPDAIGYQGVLAGLPVYSDNNIPVTLGAGTNEDRIIVHSSPCVMLWERSGDPVQLRFEGATATSLQVNLICFGYMAYTASRYLLASGVVSGSGLAAPTW